MISMKVKSRSMAGNAKKSFRCGSSSCKRRNGKATSLFTPSGSMGIPITPDIAATGYCLSTINCTAKSITDTGSLARFIFTNATAPTMTVRCCGCSTGVPIPRGNVITRCCCRFITTGDRQRKRNRYFCLRFMRTRRTRPAGIRRLPGLFTGAMTKPTGVRIAPSCLSITTIEPAKTSAL